MTFLESVDGKAITVRNIDYMIKVLSPEQIDSIEDCEIFGFASHKDSIIYLRDGMSDDRAKQTLTHEVLHAMIYESGYTFEDENQEEYVVEALSLVMNDMLRDGTMSLQYAQVNYTEEQVQDDLMDNEPLKLYAIEHIDGFRYIVDQKGYDEWAKAVKNNEPIIDFYDYSVKQTHSVSLKRIKDVYRITEHDSDGFYMMIYMNTPYIIDSNDYKRYIDALNNNELMLDVYDYAEQDEFTLTTSEIEKVEPLKNTRGEN